MTGLQTMNYEQINNWLQAHTVPVPVEVRSKKKVRTTVDVTIALMEHACTQKGLIRTTAKAEQHLENLKEKRERLGRSKIDLGEGKYDNAIERIEKALEVAYRSPLFPIQ